MTKTEDHLRIEEIPLAHADGRPTTLGEFRGDPLIVILVRYFGCLPCQQFVKNVDLAVSRFAPGANVIAVGGSADSQARWLREKKGVDMPLLLDSDQRVRTIADVGDLTSKQLRSAEGWKNYGRAIRAGYRLQKPTDDARKAPGIAIFDRDFEIQWVHAGKVMGDYPTVDELIERTTVSAT